MEETERKVGKPPISVWRIAGELLAGGLGGAGVGSLVLYAGVLSLERTSLDDFAALGFAMFIGLIGSVVGPLLGSTIGVYLVGSLGDETGSLWITLGGSIIGVLVCRLMTYFAAPCGSFGTALLGFTSAVLVSISPTIAFNLTRRYK